MERCNLTALATAARGGRTAGLMDISGLADWNAFSTHCQFVFVYGVLPVLLRSPIASTLRFCPDVVNFQSIVLVSGL